MNELKKALKCALCLNPPFVDGAEIEVVSFSESGKVINPYEGKEQSMGITLPMCGYHMVLSGERMIALTKDNRIITVRKVPEFEKLTDGSLIVRSKLSRSPQLKKEAEVAKIILTARKMQKGIEDNEQKKTRDREEKNIKPN